jgi:REP element-mobilizing transposase RayT
MKYRDTLQFGCYYHIYNRGNNSEALFKEERNYLYFLDLFKKYIIPIVDVYAYCLLPTHFHFFLRIRDGDEIGIYYQEDKQLWTQFRSFLGTYTKEINKLYQRAGHLFESRYSRKLVQKDDYFFQLILYIHQNPQTHGVVSDYKNWPFSSYLAYLKQDLRSIVSKELLFDDDLCNTIVEMHHKPIIRESELIFW